jgi:rhodanese-related sulfurtransferase
MLYRLADGQVLQLWLSLRSAAEARLAEIEQITREFAVEGAEEVPVARSGLEALVAGGEVVVIDVRPTVEYEHGHLPDAISLPLKELLERLSELPRDRRIVAYCRGAHCLFADEAVALLRRHGFDAHRLEGGWPEWRAEGRPVISESDELGVSPSRP